jgi:hypothetical protein
MGWLIVRRVVDVMPEIIPAEPDPDNAGVWSMAMDDMVV